MTQRPRNVARRVAPILFSVLVLGACSGTEDDPPAEGPTPSAGQQHALETLVRTGRVTGKLGRGEADRAAADVAAVVDAWHEAAYLGDYPRDDFEWPGFRPGLAKQARRDRDLTSNARLGDRIDGVQPRVRNVTVDLLAVRGKAVGATARFRLVLDTTGQAARTVVVRGRLALVPVKAGWQVFEYDVARAQRGRQK